MCIFRLVEQNLKPVRPSWHRKSQKAYQLYRVITWLSVVAAFVLCGVIWFGVEKVIH